MLSTAAGPGVTVVWIWMEVEVQVTAAVWYRAGSWSTRTCYVAESSVSGAGCWDTGAGCWDTGAGCWELELVAGTLELTAGTLELAVGILEPWFAHPRQPLSSVIQWFGLAVGQVVPAFCYLHLQNGTCIIYNNYFIKNCSCMHTTN